MADLKDISVREWIKRYDQGIYGHCSSFYDWFCDESRLSGKAKMLGAKVKVLAQSPKINQDTMYVWFKNNCPMVGGLYDDIRFSDRKTQDVIYTITPRDTHAIRDNKGPAIVWGMENDFAEPLVDGSWQDVLNFFEVKRQKLLTEKRERTIIFQALNMLSAVKMEGVRKIIGIEKDELEKVIRKYV